MALRARPCRIAAARRSRSSARRLARGLALPDTRRAYSGALRRLDGPPARECDPRRLPRRVPRPGESPRQAPRRRWPQRTAGRPRPRTGAGVRAADLVPSSPPRPRWRGRGGECGQVALTSRGTSTTDVMLAGNWRTSRTVGALLGRTDRRSVPRDGDRGAAAAERRSASHADRPRSRSRLQAFESFQHLGSPWLPAHRSRCTQRGRGAR